MGCQPQCLKASGIYDVLPILKGVMEDHRRVADCANIVIAMFIVVHSFIQTPTGKQVGVRLVEKLNTNNNILLV